jgi:hypothetical protein
MRLVARVALLATFSFLALAQTETSISGIVTDPSGAVVPNASIVVANAQTGAQRDTTSDAEGRYSIQQMQPGTYKVSAKFSGFSTVEVENVRLLVKTPATLDLKFESVGKVTETVAVAGESVQVNTVDATLGNAIGTKPIIELPFDARNVVSLLSIQPGVTFFGDPSARDDYRTGAVNGGKSDQGNVTLDGVDVNDQQNRTAFTSVLRVTLDSVQEFRTTTTNGGADVGRTSGAQVSLVTKSGTNEFHGSLYEYHRNTLTAANTFFNNSAGVERQKLIRNIFGASLGGPIKRNRLFFFLNYEGRRDASDFGAERIVPTAAFRQGIFTYVRNDGSTGQLSPEQIRDQIDPQHLGPSAAVMSVLQAYPEPNNTDVGDGLNTAGFRFKSPAPLTWNTYIAKIDYQLDSAGKHMLSWRGNLQNDNQVATSATATLNGVPQFPGQPDSILHLENSKGMAIGYTWIATPTLVNTIHYGFTRQGYTETGLQSTPIVTLRDIADPISNSRALDAIIPVHDIEENLSWTHGNHTVQVGGSLRFIRTKRLEFTNSFSNAVANSSWFADQGGLLEDNLLAVDGDAAGGTTYSRQMTNLLGYVTEGDAQYNYDKAGGILPQGQGISRKFVDNEYELYFQDSWKLTRGLTVTWGARLNVFPALYETNGYQTTSNVQLGTWFDQRGGLAAQGLPQSLVEPLSFNLSSAPGGRPLYPMQRHVAPRIAFAYSPQSENGFLGKLFGGPGKTSIRAGFGVYYDLFGQSLIRLADATALGFSSALSNPANADYFTTPRYINPTTVPAGLLPQAPPGGFPQPAPDAFAITTGLDDKLQGPYTMSVDFTIGRELGKGFYVQGSYVGRFSRKSLQGDDVAAPTNLRDPKSGQDYFTAAKQMQTYLRAHPDASDADVAGMPAIPFFENIFPGYSSEGLSATQVLYRDYWALNGVGNDTGALASIDDGPTYGCDPCSIYGPNAMFNPQYSSLAVFRSVGNGNYHGMQWTVRKQLSSGIQFDFNYTFSKSIDISSYRETDGRVIGQIVNAWTPSQMRAVSDYDVRHTISAFVVAELPFGRGHKFASGVNGFVNALIGGWQMGGIWRQSSSLPTGADNGGLWATNWNVEGFATQIAPIKQKTVKNSSLGGPNMFADPVAAYNAFELTFPGESGTRNAVRGDGYFTIDTSLSKRFVMPYNEKHTLQFRAEAFNVSNTARFDVNSLLTNDNVNLAIGYPSSFGKYTDTLNTPRVLQFGLRYEF